MKTIMKRLLGLMIILPVVTIILTGCATIVGGSKYYAHVTVSNNPHAKIYYDDINQGQGYASFKVRRSEADKFTLNVKDEGCAAQQFTFNHKKFRGWALVGTILTWTGAVNGIPLPWGVVVDFSTGALWKPDITEKGVSKTNYKHYNYQLEYTGCGSKEVKDTTDIIYRSEALIDTKVTEETNAIDPGNNFED